MTIRKNSNYSISNFRGWKSYTPVLGTTGSVTPVLGTTGQIQEGRYFDSGTHVDLYIGLKVGSAGFVAGDPIWTLTLPIPADTSIEGIGAGAYIIGNCTVNDVSETFGLALHAHRIGEAGVRAQGDIVVAFDATPAQRFGTATVTSGNSSLAVAHGLGITPTRVYLTPSSSLATSSMGRWWTSSLGSTNFTINATQPDASALGGNQSFDWLAIYDPGLGYLSGTFPIVLADGDNIRIRGRYRKNTN
jgi:hypothetical protein